LSAHYWSNSLLTEIEKGQGMIQKIIMNNVASYKQEAILETDKRVNLIYGLNGTGKSTFSNYLYKPSSGEYKDCTIEGLESNNEILVYNQSFIRESFYESEKIKGIFTLSQENKQAKLAVDNAEKEIENIKSSVLKQDKILVDYTREKDEKLNTIKEKVWQIKTNYTGGDRVLEYCLENLKGNKSKLFEYIINISKPQNCPVKTIDQIKIEVQALTGSVEKIPLLRSLQFSGQVIEEKEIFLKEIVGNKNSSVGKFIEELGNSDWVKQGIKFTTMEDDEATICPFCQSKTMTEELISNIRSYFDISYENDLKEIEEYEKKYLDGQESFMIYIMDNNFIAEKYKKDFDLQYEKMQNIVKNNLSKISNKLKFPSSKVELVSTNEVLTEINTIITKINIEIAEYNKKIENKEIVLSKLKLEFWSIMRWNYDTDINDYLKNTKDIEDKVNKVNSVIEQLEGKITAQKNIVSDQQKNTINIEEAIININNGLIDLGIQDFRIEKYSNEDSLYQIVRNNTGIKVFLTLSEGEKMVISFLYFIELCKGRNIEKSGDVKKIIVIDDPISSLSHIFVFNIGRMIHHEFLRSKKHEQIFILTHSLYFFYELVCMKKEDREEQQKLFRLGKGNKGSDFCVMKYEEIQNDYQSYWSIVKDKEQPPALIANCMRNIIEYFFNFVEKKDLNNVFQKKELMDNNKYQAFNRYVNRESHSLGQNILDYKEFNYDNFRDAFRLVFKEAGYEEHYKRMIK
jgi:wobble nucleotide-excising tRNase